MRPLDSVRTLGRPIAYHSSLAKHVGGVTAAIFLSQLMYWDERSKSELGVHKTAEEWELETGLSYREQAGARKKLRELGLLIETEQRLQHRIYYKLDHDAFNEFMERIFSEEFANDDNATPERRKRNSGATKAQPADEQKRNPSNDENAIRYIDIDYTETTTETTDIYTPKPPADKKAREKKTADRFEEFWQAYPNTPRRVAKKKCRERWRSRKLDQIADQIIDHVLAMKKTQQWLDGFEPGPMTYINQSRWEDGVPEESATNQRAYGKQERFDPVEYINRNRISKQLPKMEELDVIDC